LENENFEKGKVIEMRKDRNKKPGGYAVTPGPMEP